jgi:hypothetical protein
VNKHEKIVQAQFLNNEEAVIKALEKTYSQALKDIEKKSQRLYDDINDLQSLINTEADADEKARLISMKQSKVYQKQYQDALKKQINGILDTMQADQFTTVSDYLKKCYEDGFVGTMYSLHAQGIPLIFPIDQEAVTRAVQIDSKISNSLYTLCGENVDDLKKRIASEVSRGIATGASFHDIARQIRANMIGTYDKAGGALYRSELIARTEGHRVQIQSAMDACYKAKDRGADVVKQWDSTLDSRTRESHTIVDGEIRELDEKFSNGLKYPGDSAGGAAEVCNCRCALLQRSRKALDADELDILKERAQYFGLDKSKNFDDFKAKYIDAAKPPEAKPKKEYLTKKKLEQKIADIEQQQKTLSDSSDMWKQLDDEKAELQKKLDEKIVSDEKKKLKKEQILLQDQIDGFEIKTYSNIWKDDVTTKDWQAKHGSIPAKKQYFESKLIYAADIDEANKWKALIADLDDFDKQGAAYFDLQSKLAKNQGDLTKLLKSGKIIQIDDSFTQARKDAALWAKTTKDADKQLRDVCGDIWRNASDQERYAIYDYTCGSGKFNRPLSGFEKPYSEWGSGWEQKWKKGVKNVWIDFEGAGDEIRHMTNIISRSSYDIDVWLQRGCGGNAMESFLNIAPDTFCNMSNSALQQFVGRSNRMYSFTSTGVAKGKGFSGDCILNIYAPKGTQMMYAEPFSHFGDGDGLKWDGKNKQSSFGYEAEMIIQRGSSYTITKIEKSGGTIFIDMEVHPELGYDLFQQDPTEWKGSTKKGR